MSKELSIRKLEKALKTSESKPGFNGLKVSKIVGLLLLVAGLVMVWMDVYLGYRNGLSVMFVLVGLSLVIELPRLLLGTGTSEITEEMYKLLADESLRDSKGFNCLQRRLEQKGVLRTKDITEFIDVVKEEVRVAALKERPEVAALLGINGRLETEK